jgi:hypothetical protein
MGTINIKSERREVKVKGEVGVYPVYRKANFRKFGPKALKLGDIGARSKELDVIAGVFDLGGFTSFCGQVDPQLSMPKFLNEFLNWLFNGIKSELEVRRCKQGIAVWSELPFFTKFTGDGVLFLWNIENMDNDMICNIVISLRNVCRRYSRDFVPRMEKSISRVPKSLRGGVACGKVFSVGNGEDYVGACINIATRLQKLSNLGFCFSKRGIDFEDGMSPEIAERYAVKCVSIRGIGRDELVVVRKSDFEKLSKRAKVVFKDI